LVTFAANSIRRGEQQMEDLAKVMETRDGESLEEVRERFKRWRETRGRGEHVPRELWVAAVGVARVHGLHVTARERTWTPVD
jgi:hypothetical protein